MGKRGNLVEIASGGGCRPSGPLWGEEGGLVHLLQKAVGSDPGGDIERGERLHRKTGMAIGEDGRSGKKQNSGTEGGYTLPHIREKAEKLPKERRGLGPCKEMETQLYGEEDVYFWGGGKTLATRRRMERLKGGDRLVGARKKKKKNI